ncbi:CsgG/HfaB family protein [Treponema primitia]|uniref:CsgG/HfaB family protein n=1 Tax=Treponema primitia TaxID=88058 RepID=UPI00397F9C3B
MKRKFTMLFAVTFMLGAGFVFGDTELKIERVDSRINSGFRERVYIDGRSKLNLANGASGTVTVPNGPHKMYAELYTMKTEELSFTASGGTLTIRIFANAINDFAIALIGADPSRDSGAAAAVAAVRNTNIPAPAPAAPVDDNGVEGSLSRAANKIMEKLTPRTRIAIVYVTARDAEVGEYIAEELEFIMVEQNFTLIDRSQLDRIRKEQQFQISGEVNDDQAVSVGKLAGADIIITGAVTGSGDLRRLRLRALATQTAQVVVAASEKY